MTNEDVSKMLADIKENGWKCTGTNCTVTSDNYLVAEHSPECEAEHNAASDIFDKEEIDE